MFKANPGDTACPEQFYFWADRYTNGGGYQLSCSADIEAPAVDRQDAAVHQHRHRAPRHRHAARAARVEPHPRLAQPGRHHDDRALRCPSPTVQEGDALIATAKVRAADGYAVGGHVRFSAPGWEKTAYPDRGVASVTLPEKTGAPARRRSRPPTWATSPDGVQEAEPIESSGPGSLVAPIGGTVPATLALSLGGPASFGAFTPGVAKEYTATTTANVSLTAGARRSASQIPAT